MGIRGRGSSHAAVGSLRGGIMGGQSTGIIAAGMKQWQQQHSRVSSSIGSGACSKASGDSGDSGDSSSSSSSSSSSTAPWVLVAVGTVAWRAYDLCGR